jgi:Na+-transporting NADH:ubiquinone oxidoreductase subunit NqrB
MVNYLRAFVIGSSLFVFILFFITVYKIDPNKRNYTYLEYTIIAPIYLGFINMFALWISNTFNLSRRKKYLYMSIIAPLFIIFYVYSNNIYSFSLNEWIEYVLGIFLLYLFVFNIIIYNLDKYV